MLMVAEFPFKRKTVDSGYGNDTWGGVMIVKMNAAKYDVAANSTNGKLKQFSPYKINGFPQVLLKCIQQTFVGRNETRRLVLSMVMMNQSTLSSLCLCTCCLCPLMTDSDGIIECP